MTEEITILSTSESLEAAIRAETDVAINTAKKYPRDIKKCQQEALAFATMDTDVAESCFYVLKRSGNEISGPTVRLAEIIVSAYGNIKVATRIIGNDGKTITAEAVCMDTEKNVSVSIQVKRRITDKFGKTYNEDMQVVTGNAASAIAYRNAVLKVIPMALTKNVLDAAKGIAAGTEASLPVNRAKAFQYLYENFQVPSTAVLTALGKATIEDIKLEDLVSLKGMINAIRDGDSTVQETFYPQAAAQQQKGDQSIKNVLEKTKAAKTKPVKEEEPVVTSYRAGRETILINQSGEEVVISPDEILSFELGYYKSGLQYFSADQIENNDAFMVL